jgi:hypothetical protein
MKIKEIPTKNNPEKTINIKIFIFENSIGKHTTKKHNY